MVLIVKNPPANAGDIRDAGLIPKPGRSSGGGQGNPLQYSCAVHRVAQSQTRLKRLSTIAPGNEKRSGT